MNDPATILIAAVCLLIGVVIAFELLGAGGSDRDACRAANPGYECVVGWVRGEAFE